SELAADAALDLRDQLGSELLTRTTHLILASSALNETIGDSVVGRLQYDLGLQGVMPLALGQNGTLGWYGALSLLGGLLGPDDQALVILGDKWLYPFFRQFGELVGYSDAAAALLVRRGTHVPEHAELTEAELPRNPNGKTDRPTLKARHRVAFAPRSLEESPA
ncbi:hypothetical protein PPH41_44780, partial [Burkholderia gladioli]|nr:hypothetical protein [Burkholderia gladioli]